MFHKILILAILNMGSYLFSSQEAFRDKQQWFSTFLKATDQKKNCQLEIFKTLQSQYPHVYKKIQSPEIPFSFLSIGAGDGGIEIPFLKESREIRGSQEGFLMYCEDPSPQMKEGFLQHAREFGLESLVHQYELLSFENPAYHPPQVDFVLAAHSWYYINNWYQVDEDNALIKFAKAINNMGVGLISLQSHTSDRFALLQEYLPQVGLTMDIGGEDVAAELNRLKLDHQMRIVESHTSLADCFYNGEFNPNPQGKNLLSFFIRASWDDQSAQMQENLKNKILQLVQDNKKEELIFRDCFLWIAPLK